MSDENTAYYRAAGRSLDAILAWQKIVTEMNARRKAFVKKHKAEDAYGMEYSGGSVSIFGLIFAKDPGTPWKKRKQGEVSEHWSPDRTKAGQALIAEMAAMAIPRPSGIGGHFFTGRSLFTPGFQKLGEEYIISHHEEAEPPPDAIPIKRSEFWSLKESIEKTS